MVPVTSAPATQPFLPASMSPATAVPVLVFTTFGLPVTPKTVTPALMFPEARSGSTVARFVAA